MRTVKALMISSALSFCALAACGGGGPCAKSVENTAKWAASDEEKKLATDQKDNFIKACQMGLDQAPESKKLVECQANATDEKSFNDCRTSM